jgi:integrase
VLRNARFISREKRVAHCGRPPAQAATFEVSAASTFLVASHLRKGALCSSSIGSKRCGSPRRSLIQTLLEIVIGHATVDFVERSSVVRTGKPTQSIGAHEMTIPPRNLEPSRGEAAARLDRCETPELRTFADTWLTNHAIEWRRSHIRVLRSTIDGHLLPHFGEQPIGQISKADILAFRTKLAELSGRGGKGLSAKRINGILAPLKQMLAEAAEMHGFATPAVNIKPLRVKKGDVQPFSLSDVQAIINRARPDYRHYFITRFFTGMRTGEVHGLKWKYVDFEHRLILVREAFVLGEDEYTKTDSSQRDIQMSQVVFDALHEQHRATGTLSDYVFCNREGQPLDNKNFSDRVWYPLLRHLGLAARRPYQMRHTAATLWLAAGEAPEWIARQLGHASTEMLFRVYSRYVPNLTRRDGSAIDRLLASRFAGITEVAPRAPELPTPKEQPPPINGWLWQIAA